MHFMKLSCLVTGILYLLNFAFVVLGARMPLFFYVTSWGPHCEVVGQGLVRVHIQLSLKAVANFGGISGSHGGSVAKDAVMPMPILLL